MPKYSVTLCDQRNYYTTVIIQAGTENEARARASYMGYEQTDTLDWKWEDGDGIYPSEIEEV